MPRSGKSQTRQSRRGSSTKRNETNLKFELERQHKSTEKVHAETHKRIDELTKFHEKQMRDLHAQHDRDLKLLTHQNNVHVKSLRHSYDSKIQKLLDDQKLSDARMRKTATSETSAAVEAAIAQQHVQVQQQIEVLKADMAQRLQEAEASYQQKVAELDETQKQLAAANEQKLALEEAKREADRISAESRASHDQAVENLRATKNELRSLKTQYEATVEELRRALDQSRDQLQGDFEVINSLKHDKETLHVQITELSKALTLVENQLERTTSERRQLTEKLDKLQIDNGTYKSEMLKLIAEEKKQAEALADYSANLKAREARLQQCNIAISEAQSQMEAEKANHISLRQEYQNHVDRLASVTEALDKCKQSTADSQQILAEMNQRYQSLKARSDQMIAEMKKLSEENNEYKHNLEAERVRMQEMKDRLEFSRVQMQDQLKLLENNEVHTRSELSSCQQRGEQCLQATKVQAAHVSKLEAELKKSLQRLKNAELLERKVAVLDQAAAVREHELETLRQKFARVDVENQAMRNKIAEFESHYEADEKLIKEHGELKAQQAKTLLWAEELKRHHDELHQHHVLVGEQLEGTAKKLNESEAKLQERGSVIRSCEKQIEELKGKIAACAYPGQREIMEAQLKDLIGDRDRLRKKMQDLVTEHGKLFQQMETLAKENENLRVIKTRYEMESDQMQKIVQQGAELNVQLNEAKRLIAKKDEQLELLSAQLNTLIQRVKTLEGREAMLQEKLKYSATPEETEKLQTNLVACRAEMKKNLAKFQEMSLIADNLKEQNTINANKVTSLVQVLSETEAAREKLQSETATKVDLRKALQQCGDESKRSVDTLQQKIQVVEEQYKKGIISHEKAMQESSARIAELQKQLATAVEHERNTRLRMIPGVAVVAPSAMAEMEPKTHVEMVQGVERNSERLIYEVKERLAKIQKEAGNVPKPETAIRAVSLPQVEQLIDAKQTNADLMREKEHQIMEARRDTFQQLLSTLESVNGSKTNLNPNDVEGRLRQIRAQGAARESQHMAEMLELRAIKEKLTTAAKSASQIQADLLADANNTQRQQIMQAAKQGVTPALMQSVNTYQALAGAQRDFYARQQQELNRQLQAQKTFIGELESHLPLMTASVNSIDTTRFPVLGSLKQDLQKEQAYTIGSLNFEAQEAASQDRSVGVVESNLAALQAQLQMLVRLGQEYANNPSSGNAEMLMQAAQQSPSDLALLQQRQQMLRNQSAILSTAITGARPPAMTPHKQMMGDPAKAEMVLRSDAGNLRRFLFDNLLLPNEVQPRTVFAPTLARTETQLEKGHDIIAVSYSFAPRNQSQQSVRFDVFRHAVQELFPRIRLLNQSGKVVVQFVRVGHNGHRYDVLDGNKALANKCTYNTCASKPMQVNDLEAVMNILRDKLPQNQADDDETHFILTLSVDGSSAHVHIIDVLYRNLDDPKNDVAKMRLIDNSWIGYLVDQVSDPDVKIDLFSNFVPFEATDKATAEANKRIGEISDRIKYFLYQLKQQ